MTAKILVIDDEASMRQLIPFILRTENYQITTAENAQQTHQLLEQQQYDLIIQDMKLPDADGIVLLSQIKQQCPQTMVIVITALLDWQIAVEAMRVGAFDYIRKPFDNKNFRDTISRALKYKQIQDILKTPGKIQNIIGNSLSIQNIQDIIRRAAPTDSTVLIHGESGTGKELVARAIHISSLRAQNTFIPVNCGAITESLIESELFGHVKGAFTNAIADKQGLIETANNGTIFFDEIAEMPPTTQVKLLRVLEYREFIPVGSNTPKHADVRFIAATNQNLEQQIEKGEFREDLYYRLNVIPIHLPPLRERKEDIPLLAGHFLSIYSNRMHKYIKNFTEQAMQKLTSYHWPGNIRELSNAIQRAIILTEHNVIQKEDIEQSIPETHLYSSLDPLSTNFSLEKKLEEIEEYYIQQALKQTQGNLTNAAKLLNISFRSIRYKVQKFKIDV